MRDPDGARVDAAVGRVAARMRVGVALRAAERGLWAVGILALPLVAATRLGWLGRGAAAGLLAASAGVAALLIVWRARPVPALDAAAAADRALSLSDRLTSAVAFLAEAAPTPLMQLAIADGARVSAGVDPRAVVGLRLPGSARALPLLAVALALVALVRLPRAPVVARPLDAKPRLVVEEDALVAEREALRRLREEQRGKDPRLAALAEELDRVLEEIDQRKLSRNEAFARLAALEAKVAAERAQAPPPPTQELAALQKALASSKATRDVADALKKDDLASAQKELEKLAAAAEARAKAEPSSKEDEAQRELARALDRASKALDDARKQQEQARDRKIEELKEEQRRLQKRQQEHPEDQETERKLQRNQRELERLERERQAQQEQRRQLERLSRELQKAAEQLRSKMSPEAMKRAAEQLGKMEDEIRKLGSSAQAMMQIGELKEVLRRAGRVESGGGGEGQGQGQAQRTGQQNGKGAHGKHGEGQGRGERLAEFDERAGGQPNALLLGGEGDPGQGSVLLPLPGGPGDGQGGGKDPGEQKGGGKGDPERPGDGIGDEHDPNLFGDRTSNKTGQKLIRAHGQAGAGPSRSQTILGAAERGFSSRDYGRVYKDYSAVVEEVMSQEGVPPGYRYYVKRYFQLIRPRE